MADFKAVVKIDLCSSKRFFEEHGKNDDKSRASVLKELVQVSEQNYPEADKTYPKGSRYVTQGDCVYIVLDKPTVALRSTIEFMKQWASNLNIFPDCRSVIDFGEIEQVSSESPNELIGSVFDNISVIEKHFNEGQIGVTKNLTEHTDPTLVQFVKERTIQVTPTRSLSAYLVNYEDPRLIDDSSLVHTLFITDAYGDEIRTRTFEALIISYFIERNTKRASLMELESYFESKNCPIPQEATIDEILSNSKYLIKKGEVILLESEKADKLAEIGKEFTEIREATINRVIDIIGKRLGVSSNILAGKIRVAELIEEYLCAVFLEIRMMANYFRSTNTLFHRLSESSEFDYIIMKYFSSVLKDHASSKERFIMIRSLFIETLASLAQENNKYFAAIFHNVLTLYYLNRNFKYAHGQLSKLKEKEIFLDTNTLYAFVCQASDYYSLLHYSLDKLNTMGATLKAFDKSLDEYNESLDSSLRKYHGGRETGYFLKPERPWIWKEFEKNLRKYRNNFEYCVELHRLSISQNESVSVRAKNKFGKNLIRIIKLQPYFEKKDLGDLYNEVYHVKLRPQGSPFGAKTEEEHHARVLHDSNCLRFIKDRLPNEETSPYKSKILFVTCDYRLAKVRKRFQRNLDFVVTITEFYEYMLPYLFLENIMTTKPVEMPNFLLASTLYRELNAEKMDFESIFGTFLASKDEAGVSQDFGLLSDLQASDRFRKVKEKQEKLSKLKDAENRVELGDFIKEVTQTFGEYLNKVKESVAQSLVQEKLSSIEDKMEQLIADNKNLRSQLKTSEIKRRRRERFKRRQKEQSKK
jgi:hypothetical protein